MTPCGGPDVLPRSPQLAASLLRAAALKAQHLAQAIESRDQRQPVKGEDVAAVVALVQEAQRNV